MKRLLSIYIFCCGVAAAEPPVIWQEDFSGCTGAGVTGLGPVHYPAGTTNWSINVSACTTLTPGSGSTGDYFMAVATGGGRMEASNVDGEAVWSSAMIDISGCTNVSLSVSTSETGSSASTNKYVKLFYRLNGGVETAFQISPVNAGNWGAATAQQSNLCGVSVQIIGRVNNPNAGDKSVFDSVMVYGDRTISANSTNTAPAAVFGSSRIAGKFYGWTGDTVFKLENGQFWQQSAPGTRTASPALYHPCVSITNIPQPRMVVSNVTGYVTVAPVSVTESLLAHLFSGLHYQNIFRLADGTVWKQISFENIPASGTGITGWRWIKDGRQILRFLDRAGAVIGTCTVEAVAGCSESVITNTFNGLHYGNVYRLADGRSWLQISFENIRTNISNPEVMFWTDGTGTNLLVRSGGITIGTCNVVDPALDDDRDGLGNAAEVLADSDPFNAQSRFELRQTDHCTLRWDPAEGRVYTVEWTPELTKSFQPLQTGIVWPQNSWTDTVHSSETKSYYRITVRLAE